MEVIGNEQLNVRLQKLADLLSSSISLANKSVVEAIKARFGHPSLKQAKTYGESHLCFILPYPTMNHHHSDCLSHNDSG